MFRLVLAPGTDRTKWNSARIASATTSFQAVNLAFQPNERTNDHDSLEQTG